MLNLVSQVKVSNLMGCTQSNPAFGNLTQASSVSSASSNLNFGMRSHTLPQDSFTFTGTSKTGKSSTEEGGEASLPKEPTKKRKRGQADGTPKASQNDDWAEVQDPEERRRIQNRIAQRKFREKTREQAERAAREETNSRIVRESAEEREKFLEDHTYSPVDEKGNWDSGNHPKKKGVVLDEFGQEVIVNQPYAIKGLFWDPVGIDALREKDNLERW